MDNEYIKQQQSLTKDMVDQFLLFLEEISLYTLNYLDCSIANLLTPNNQTNISAKFNNEIKKGYKNFLNLFKIEFYILLNKRKLYIDDIYGCLTIIDRIMSEIDTYYEEIFETYMDAIEMNLDRRFYIPKKEPSFITDKQLEKYKSYLKGYNLENIKEFLVAVNVYGEDIEEVLKKLKVIKSSSDSTEFLGIYEDGTIVIPEIIDDKSMLIIVNILVKYAMLLNVDKISLNNEILLEELPLLYEKLYKQYNNFIKENPRNGIFADKLYEEFNGETVSELVEKIKTYKI